MLQSREVTLRRCRVKQFTKPETTVEADFIGFIRDTGCDRCGGDEPFYAVVKQDGQLYLDTVHMSRLEFEGPGPYPV